MAETAAAVEALRPRPVVAPCETARGILAAPEIAAATASVCWGQRGRQREGDQVVAALKRAGVLSV